MLKMLDLIVFMSYQCDHSNFRYAVDGYWRHDPEIAVVKNEFGHFNNVIKIDNLPDIQKTKIPKPKSSSRSRCLSGDDTLVMSGGEDVLSLNDTFVLSEDNNTFDDGNISEDEDQVWDQFHDSKVERKIGKFLLVEFLRTLKDSY